jgi:hypothetical protein
MTDLIGWFDARQKQLQSATRTTASWPSRESPTEAPRRSGFNTGNREDRAVTTNETIALVVLIVVALILVWHLRVNDRT